MPKHVWSVLAKGAHQDLMGRMTLFECPTQIVSARPAVVEKEHAAGQVPGLRTALVVVSHWWYHEGAKEEPTLIRLVLVDPSGKRHVGQEEPNLLPVKVEGGESANSMINMAELPFHGWGVYRFEVQTKPDRERTRWSSVAHIPFRMRVPPDQGA